MSAYDVAKAQRDALDAEVTRLGAVLQDFPKGPMGLTLDAVRGTLEYRNAKLAYDAAFHKLRVFNQGFLYAFRTEIRNERKQRRKERLA